MQEKTNLFIGITIGSILLITLYIIFTPYKYLNPQNYITLVFFEVISFLIGFLIYFYLERAWK